MLSLIKNKLRSNNAVEPTAAIASTETTPASWLQRLRTGLGRTRQTLSAGIAQLLLGKKILDAALFEELETLLLTADVGVEATQALLQELTQRVSRHQLTDGEAVLKALREQLEAILKPCERTFHIDRKNNTPYVILFVGINGAGKTTTVGKLAKYFQTAGHSLLLAAGDTFRAAAIEQLQAWGQKNQVPVIAQQAGADSASVIYDAFDSARAKQMDILLADTAGRLHTKDHLMEELKKVIRVLTKFGSQLPQEKWLVLDASIGQNTLQQVKEFHAALKLTGLIVTKLDGTAKGGVLFALAKNIQLPIYFIGVGEGIDDLHPFSAKDYVDALFK